MRNQILHKHTRCCIKFQLTPEKCLQQRKDDPVMHSPISPNWGKIRQPLIWRMGWTTVLLLFAVPILTLLNNTAWSSPCEPPVTNLKRLSPEVQRIRALYRKLGFKQIRGKGPPLRSGEFQGCMSHTYMLPGQTGAIEMTLKQDGTILEHTIMASRIHMTNAVHMMAFVMAITRGEHAEEITNFFGDNQKSQTAHSMEIGSWWVKVGPSNPLFVILNLMPIQVYRDIVSTKLSNRNRVEETINNSVASDDDTVLSAKQLEDSGDYEGARKSFLTAINDKNTSEEVKLGYMRVTLALAEKKLSQKNLSAALGLYNEALEKALEYLPPKEVDTLKKKISTIHILKADKHLMAEDYYAALREYLAAVNIDPTRKESLCFKMAKTHAEIAREAAMGLYFPKAIDEVKHSLDLNPGNKLALDVISNMRSYQKNSLVWPSLISGVVGIASIGVGVYFGTQATGVANDIQSGPHTNVDEMISGGKGKAVAANILLGIGGAASITSVILYLVGHSKIPEALRGVDLDAIVSMNPNGSHVSLTARF